VFGEIGEELQRLGTKAGECRRFNRHQCSSEVRFQNEACVGGAGSPSGSIRLRLLLRTRAWPRDSLARPMGVDEPVPALRQLRRIDR
jgi:hypothetical protein